MRLMRPPPPPPPLTPPRSASAGGSAMERCGKTPQNASEHTPPRASRLGARSTHYIAISAWNPQLSPPLSLLTGCLPVARLDIWATPGLALKICFTFPAIIKLNCIPNRRAPNLLHRGPGRGPWPSAHRDGARCSWVSSPSNVPRAFAAPGLEFQTARSVI